MIQNKKPLTLAEVHDVLKHIDSEKAKNVADFIKKFIKISPAEAANLRQKIESLNIAKLRDEDAVKIADFMPDDAEDLKKIFAGGEISLNQDEITQLLELLKQKK